MTGRAVRAGNLLADSPDASAVEVIDEFLAVDAAGARLERIFSDGQASPDGFWYDQAWAEWVVVLAGRAEVAVADPAASYTLGPNDWLFLPAHCRHRVASTARGTRWLAVHFAR